MSNKKAEHILLFPGGEGWEVWKGSPVAGYQLHSESGKMRALEASVPAGSLCMAMPVRQLTALPFKAQTEDISLLDDLATMHVERSSMRPEMDGGTLSDHFVLGKEDEEMVLLPVVLAAPTVGSLPKKSPQAFDLAPRCLPLPHDGLVVWKELGRWVFAVGRGDKVLFFQTLSGSLLDAEAGREIKLSLAQLELQELISTSPSALTVWTTGGHTDARPEEIESLRDGIGLEVHETPKPKPIWPSPASRLLPADVRAERAAKKNKQQRQLLITACLLGYLGLLAYLGLKLKTAEEEATAAQQEVDDLAPAAEVVRLHREKWDELLPVVESDYYPYELYHRVIDKVIPTGQIKINRATFVNTLKPAESGDGLTAVRTIAILGQSEDAGVIAKYNNNIKGSDLLRDFRWNTQEPTKSKELWRFTYTAQVPE